MTAPHTDIEKQKRRHRGPLIGMALVTIFAVALILYWVFEEAATAPDVSGERQVPSLAPPGGEGPMEPAPAATDQAAPPAVPPATE